MEPHPTPSSFDQHERAYKAGHIKCANSQLSVETGRTHICCSKDGYHCARNSRTPPTMHRGCETHGHGEGMETCSFHSRCPTSRRGGPVAESPCVFCPGSGHTHIHPDSALLLHYFQQIDAQTDYYCLLLAYNCFKLGCYRQFLLRSSENR